VIGNLKWTACLPVTWSWIINNETIAAAGQIGSRTLLIDKLNNKSLDGLLETAVGHVVSALCFVTGTQNVLVEFQFRHPGGSNVWRTFPTGGFTATAGAVFDRTSQANLIYVPPVPEFRILLTNVSLITPTSIEGVFAIRSY